MLSEGVCTHGTKSAPLLNSMHKSDPSHRSRIQALRTSQCSIVDPKVKGSGKQLKFRQAKKADARAVASLCADVFESTTFYGLPLLLRTTKADQTAKKLIQKDVDFQIVRSLKIKQKAQMEAREHKLTQLSRSLRAELAQLDSRPEATPNKTTPSPLQQRATRIWSRSRQFACIMAAQAGGSQSVAGCAVLSLATPQALLPPPWPSRAPLQCCVSNLAVAHNLRRQGIGRQLLHRCEILARRWGHKDLWLHTEVHNQAAKQLYLSLGYREIARDPFFFGPFQRVLLRKLLVPCNQP